MLRKLFSRLFKSSVPSSEVPLVQEEPKQLGEAAPVIQLNIDTGKLILPDNITPEVKAELEAAMKELKDSLTGPGVYDSLESFLKDNSTALVIPFTVVNADPEGYAKIASEMYNVLEDNDHWSDLDYVEALMGFHNDGYDFDNLEHLYNKLAENVELDMEEKMELRKMYMLVSQETVYDV